MSAKTFTFSSPVDASVFIAGGDPAAPGIGMLNISYDEPAYYRFRVQNGDGSLSDQVVAVNVDNPSEASAAADIRAAIAATLP